MHVHESGRLERRRRRRCQFAASTAVAVVTGLIATGTATGAATGATTGAAGATRAAGHDQQLHEYAADTWRSFEAMADPRTGLPSDNIAGDLDAGGRSGFTSPTNIGASLWSTVAARDIGLITRGEARRRMAQTLASVSKLERNEPSGMFYNWYDPATGEKLRTWPADNSVVKPFLSSVDNGWLATGLLLTARADPSLARKADAIRKGMDFGCYYNAAENAPGGQIRGGFWDEDLGEGVRAASYCGGPDVWYTGHHYGAFNTEPRIASYLGIAAGQIPDVHYYGTHRTFPDTCDWSWTETKPVGEWREYDGMRVFEGALPYRDATIVPTWGGSMFEALMVPLFVPEERWGPRSWGVNHPLYVRAQIQHGTEEAGYGYWGFSPSNNPAGGYREYGVDQLGLDAAGYTSDQERTLVDQPYGDCPAREGSPAPTEYGDGVVTPHASFLALRYAEDAALENLAKIRSNFDAYGPGGFYDAVAVGSGQVSQRYLALDQGMIMAALGNRLAGDDMRDYVSAGAMRQHPEPLMRQEVFSAGRS